MNYSNNESESAKNTNEKELPLGLTIKYNGTIFSISNARVKVKKQLNKHTKAIIEGTITDDQYDTAVIITNTKTNIEIIYHINSKKIQLFTGLITDIQTTTEGINGNAVYNVHIEALSYSCLLDIKYINRSFQNVDMLYDDLLKEIIKDYDNGGILNIAGDKKILDGFTMQYRENDWEFLKRMASRFNSPLVVDHHFKAPKIKFGLRFYDEIKDIPDFNYRVLKNADLYRDIVQNNNAGFQELDTVQYEVFTEPTDDCSFEIGDAVRFKEVVFRVYEVEAYIKNHILTHKYILSSKSSFYQKSIYNENIVGLTLKGKVTRVISNQLKVQMDIDSKVTPIDKAYLFDYATLYSKWYCMPEVGDYVNIYFSNHDEFNGMVINSIKQSPSAAKKIQGTALDNSADESGKSANAPLDFETLAGDEKVKMLATEQGKMVILDDRQGRVTILCNNGTYVVLTDQGGISIVTGNDIVINAGGDVNINSGQKINIEAKEEIKILCGESNIIINPSEIKAKATDIYLNE